MDLTSIHTQFKNLNDMRFNEQISHRAWHITIKCINDTLTAAGYTWDDMLAAGDAS